MKGRHWRRHPHRVLATFVAVALLSFAALVWLSGLLLEQEEPLEAERRRKSLEQSAATAVVAVQRTIAGLQAMAVSPPPPGTPLPEGVSLVTIRDERITARPAGSLLYYPATEWIEAPAGALERAERLEFIARDRRAAAREYSWLAESSHAGIRAAALVALARVLRQLGDPEGALAAYDRLERIDGAAVGDVPAGLLAMEGRARVFLVTRRTADLQRVSSALLTALHDGRWRLTRSQYESYAADARARLGGGTMEDPDAIARAEAVGWLWTNRASLGPGAPRALGFPSGPALVAWYFSGAGLNALVAGRRFISTLCAAADNVRCVFTDSEGRTVTGEAPPADAVVMAMAVTRLPWTLHVLPSAADAVAPPTRTLLLTVLGVVGAVLIGGWYFSFRAITRELRVAQLQSEFVSAVSHEFRSPLTTLCQISEMLAQDRFQSDTSRRQSYDVLVRDADRLRRLVEGLLDFRRFEAGASAFRFEIVDISALVRGVVEDFQDRVRVDGYDIELRGAADAIHLRTDREALSRALWNLLDNAVKYSPQCRTVWVDIMRDGRRVHISVRDRGLGIPVHEQQDVFNPFVRGAESTSLRIKGTGVGLAMVRQIAEAHGGEVRLSSEPGQGSQFSLVLPTSGGAA